MSCFLGEKDRRRPRRVAGPAGTLGMAVPESGGGGNADFPVQHGHHRETLRRTWQDRCGLHNDAAPSWRRGFPTAPGN